VDIIEVQHLSYRYPTAQKPSLRDINLRIKKGELCAIVGANDSGKTTLCHAIRGFLPHFHKGEMEGDVFVMGENTRSKTIAGLCGTVGIVVQNPFTQLSGVAETAYEEIAFGLENMGIPFEETRKRVENILKLFNLDELRDRNPFELSGGQQQILSLASIMVMEPDVLVMDEPTSQVDPQSTEEIYQIINFFKEKGTTIVLVEHKMELIAQFADHVVMLENGAVVMDGKPSDIFSDPEIIKYKVSPPRYAMLGMELQKRGFPLHRIPITENQAVSQIKELLSAKGGC